MDGSLVLSLQISMQERGAKVKTVDAAERIRRQHTLVEDAAVAGKMTESTKNSDDASVNNVRLFAACGSLVCP